jgi:hypothetical protein
MTDKPHKNVYCALAAAQMEMGAVVKGSTNPHFNTKYADLNSLMMAVLPALNENGIAVFSQIVKSDGAQYMRSVLMHGETETSIECDVPLLVAKSDMQGMKSATTYAKRVGIESLTGKAPEDDDGNGAKAGEDKYRQEREEQAAQAAVKAVQGAVDILRAANTLDALQSAWMALPKNVRADKDVIDAKNDMKGVLDAESLAADLNGDSIPY